jgi:hypothetical protein
VQRRTLAGMLGLGEVTGRSHRQKSARRRLGTGHLFGTSSLRKNSHGCFFVTAFRS